MPVAKQSASPATGFAKRHAEQQEALVATALGLASSGKSAPTPRSTKKQAEEFVPMTTEVKVPTLGESVTEATIGEWLKQPGDAVALDEPIASLETDKVAVEVPSPVAGVMGELKVEAGATVQVGAVIATVEAGDGAIAAKPADAPAAAPAPPLPPLPPLRRRMRAPARPKSRCPLPCAAR